MRLRPRTYEVLRIRSRGIVIDELLEAATYQLKPQGYLLPERAEGARDELREVLAELWPADQADRKAVLADLEALRRAP